MKTKGKPNSKAGRLSDNASEQEPAEASAEASAVKTLDLTVPAIMWICPR